MTLNVRLTNAGKQPVSFEPQWLLGGWGADGVLLGGVPGRIMGEVRPLQEAEQFNVRICFPCLPWGVQWDTNFVLTGSDIYGNPVQAKFPSV